MIFGKNELGRPVITFIKTKLLEQLTPYMKKWKRYQLEQNMNFRMEKLPCSTLSKCFGLNIKKLIIEKFLCSPQGKMHGGGSTCVRLRITIPKVTCLSIWMRHGSVPMIQPELFDNTEKCTLSSPRSKGKRIVICHAGSTEGFVPNLLLLCGKQLSESNADYHVDTNENFFEECFENTLSKHLPLDKKVLSVIHNAK